MFLHLPRSVIWGVGLAAAFSMSFSEATTPPTPTKGRLVGYVDDGKKLEESAEQVEKAWNEGVKKVKSFDAVEVGGKAWRALVEEIQSADYRVGTSEDFDFDEQRAGLRARGLIGLQDVPGRGFYIRRDSYSVNAGATLSAYVARAIDATLPVGLSFDFDRTVDFFRVYRTQKEALLDKKTGIRLPVMPWKIPTDADSMLRLDPGTAVRIPAQLRFSLGRGESEQLVDQLARHFTYDSAVQVNANVFIQAGYEVILYRPLEAPDMLRLQIISTKDSGVRVGLVVGNEFRLAEDYLQKGAKNLIRKVIGGDILRLDIFEGRQSIFSLADYTYDSRNQAAKDAFSAAMRGGGYLPDGRIFFNAKSTKLQDAKRMHNLFRAGLEGTRELADADASKGSGRRVVRNFDGFSHTTSQSNGFRLNLAVFRADVRAEETMTVLTARDLSDLDQASELTKGGAGPKGSSSTYAVGAMTDRVGVEGFLGWRKEFALADAYALRHTNEDGEPVSPFIEVGMRYSHDDSRLSAQDVEEITGQMSRRLSSERIPEAEAATNGLIKDLRAFLNEAYGDLHSRGIAKAQFRLDMRIQPEHFHRIREAFLQEYERAATAAGQEVDYDTYVKYLQERMETYVDWYYSNSTAWLAKFANYPWDSALCKGNMAKRLSALLAFGTPAQGKKDLRAFAVGPGLGLMPCQNLFRRTALPIFLYIAYMVPASKKASYKDPVNVRAIVTGRDYELSRQLRGQSTISYRESIDGFLSRSRESRDPTGLYRRIIPNEGSVN